MLEPRVHLAPPNGGAGHFNVLRGHLGPEQVSGVKVVGDFVGNWRLGLPSELALVLLLDPGTGVPLGIVDGTMLTAARTGALTALGAKHLARPRCQNSVRSSGRSRPGAVPATISPSSAWRLWRPSRPESTWRRSAPSGPAVAWPQSSTTTLSITSTRSRSTALTVP